jgi:AraC family transcriptional regulator
MRATPNSVPNRYQDIYPSQPLLDSKALARPSAAGLLTLEYFEAPPAEMPTLTFAQHHILLNLRETPHRVENWRDGVHRDFIFHKDEIIVTPAGVASGWRWHATSRVIVITLEPAALEAFARSELGVLLTGEQLKDLAQFTDADICAAGSMLLNALADKGVGSAVMFESLARVFLVKLIQRYGDMRDADRDFRTAFTADHYARVLDHVEANLERAITVEELADKAAMSPFHFSRLFKETIGQSPGQFVMAMRIERARKLLSSPRLALGEVALRCGFADQAHFSRAFKQAAGASPGAYRKGLGS